MNVTIPLEVGFPVEPRLGENHVGSWLKAEQMSPGARFVITHYSH